MRDIVPFVHRTVATSGGGIEETLMLGGRVVNSLVVDEPAYAITDPYTLKLSSAES